MRNNDTFCQTCKNKYDPFNSTSFFMLKYCSEQCETAAQSHQETYDMYLCIKPLKITVAEDGQTATVKEGTKWRLDNANNKGLNTHHLVNITGLARETFSWLEVSDDTLEKHFQKLN